MNIFLGQNFVNSIHYESLIILFSSYVFKIFNINKYIQYNQNIHPTLTILNAVLVLKGSVRYMFTNLICMSKTNNLWNKEKCFYFLSKCYKVIKCLSMKFWPDYVRLQNNFFILKLYGKCGLKTCARPFLIFKESSVKGICRGKHADLD